MFDETDQEIVKLLQEDGRQTYTTIAKKIRITEATARKRIKGLLRAGIISPTVTLKNPSVMGYTVAIVGIDTDPPKLLEVAEKLTNLKEVCAVWTSAGDHDLLCEIWAKEKKLSEHIADISALEGVERVCPAIIMERLKP